jgi:hypothetical protein
MGDIRFVDCRLTRRNITGLYAKRAAENPASIKYLTACQSIASPEERTGSTKSATGLQRNRFLANGPWGPF